jgi:UDP-galactopyranose mutase
MANAPRIVVIGAGPTGLGAAYRLTELGHPAFQVYERHPYIGGLAHSFVDPRGFTWDIGGHVMFSHYEYYDRVFERLMGDEYTLNNREAWVRLLGRWVPYPFQNNIRCLPRDATYECLAGLVRAQLGRGRVRSPAEARNFAEFNDAVFGEGICRLFMRPYNFKVWAHPPETLSKTWLGERVAIVDVERAIRNVVLEQDDFGWGPNNRFKFPLRGGTGEFYRRFGPVIGDRLTLNKPLRWISPDERVAVFADGEQVRFDSLLSTMPLDVLCRDVVRGVPDEVRDAAVRLRHASGWFVGVGIRRPCPSTKCWMYFPEDNCPFYRVTYLSNYSPFMTPDKATHYSLLCEVSSSEFKPVNGETIAAETIRGLVNAGLISEEETRDIVSTWVHHASYSYPVPTVERDELLGVVIPWLEHRGIYSRGRFGMWKYEVSNTDHSLMQGVELVDRLLLGKPETTIGIVYTSTADGRAAAVHERPSVAGSGEKRLRPAVPEVVVRAGQVHPAPGRP